MPRFRGWGEYEPEPREPISGFPLSHGCSLDPRRRSRCVGVLARFYPASVSNRPSWGFALEILPLVYIFGFAPIAYARRASGARRHGEARGVYASIDTVARTSAGVAAGWCDRLYGDNSDVSENESKSSRVTNTLLR